MAAESVAHEAVDIGSIAGLIWNYLDANRAVTLSKLVKDIEMPRDAVMQGVGWLAREGKVRFDETTRSKLIVLA